MDSIKWSNEIQDTIGTSAIEENQLTVFALGVGSMVGGEKFAYEKRASHFLVYGCINGVPSNGLNREPEHRRD
jgi:hypothetical protein